MYHILVVDDEPNIRQLIQKYASFEGHKVTQAADGAEALEICRQCGFDLVILDVMMPELDGFATLERLRRSSPRTPVLMLSARGEEYDRIRGFELGVDDYVVKPFSPKELMLRVSAILRRAGDHEDLRAVYTLEGGSYRSPAALYRAGASVPVGVLEGFQVDLRTVFPELEREEK